MYLTHPDVPYRKVEPTFFKSQPVQFLVLIQKVHVKISGSKVFS